MGIQVQQVQVDTAIASGDDASVAANDDECDKQSVTDTGETRYNYYKMKKIENRLDSLPHIIIDLGFM